MHYYNLFSIISLPAAAFKQYLSLFITPAPGIPYNSLTFRIRYSQTAYLFLQPEFSQVTLFKDFPEDVWYVSSGLWGLQVIPGSFDTICKV